MYRSRRHTLIAATAAALTLLTAGVEVFNFSSNADAATGSAGPKPISEPGKEEPPTEWPVPEFPRPGGGRQAIYTYTHISGELTYLLDTHSGEYRRLPYVNITLSPDRRTAAVEHRDGRTGVADRGRLLRIGAAAVRWTTLPPGSMAGWSPDGRALLTTTLDKGTRTFTAHRYDITNKRIRPTLIRLGCDVCTAGWASDSKRYVVRLRGSDPDVPTGPMQYLNPDGTPGPLVGAEGHIWNANGYAPNRRYAIVDPSRPFSQDGELVDWQLPKILDVRYGKVVSTIRTAWPLLGWYDNNSVVRIAPLAADAPTTLEVVDIRTQAVTRRVPAPGLPAAARIELGAAGRLHGGAATLGF